MIPITLLLTLINRLDVTKMSRELSRFIEMIDRGSGRYQSRRYCCGTVPESHRKNTDWYRFAFVEVILFNPDPRPENQ
jgi:hypothetical protein